MWKGVAEGFCGTVAGSASGEKRSQSLLASVMQAKDSGASDLPVLKSFRSGPPQWFSQAPPAGTELELLAEGRLRSLGRNLVNAPSPLPGTAVKHWNSLYNTKMSMAV